MVTHQQFVDHLGRCRHKARARSPAVAAVDQLLRQHISSWIGGSNLVCAFPAKLGNGPSAEDCRRHSIADFTPSSDLDIIHLGGALGAGAVASTAIICGDADSADAHLHSLESMRSKSANSTLRQRFYWPGADTPGVRLRDAEIAAYGTQEMITLEWQVVGLLG